MQKILERILAVFARAILKRHSPTIIAVVGSIGKTSTKDAIYHVISSSAHTWRSLNSLNNELGVPLTIIGAEPQGKNVLGWVLVAVIALWRLIDPRYPTYVITEFGEQKPGDIKYLMELVRPSVVVVTAIEKVHYEFFGSVENLTKEIGTSVRMLPTGAIAIMNNDDPLVQTLIKDTTASVVKIGTTIECDISVTDVHVTMKRESIGIACKLSYGGSTVPVFVPGIAARQQLYALMNAAAVALQCGMNLVTISERLSTYKQPRGRATLIEGIHGSLLIDDTYNASPAASLAALAMFNDILVNGIGRKIAIFGDMLELGSYADEGHRLVGYETVKKSVDALVTVGDLATRIANGASEMGMPSTRIHALKSQQEAIEFVTRMIGAGDCVLVKGSQGARMERVVKALMARPEQAQALLVRQSTRWLRKES